jgi:hypothetical protein
MAADPPVQYAPWHAYRVSSFCPFICTVGRSPLSVRCIPMETNHWYLRDVQARHRCRIPPTDVLAQRGQVPGATSGGKQEGTGGEKLARPLVPARSMLNAGSLEIGMSTALVLPPDWGSTRRTPLGLLLLRSASYVDCGLQYSTIPTPSDHLLMEQPTVRS